MQRITQTKVRGFSFIECMISILLGSWLCVLIIQHMHIAQYNTDKNHALISYAYDKAMLSDLLRHSIQQAGFTPCRTITHLIHAERLQAINLQPTQPPQLRVARMEDNYATILEIISPTHLRAANHANAHLHDPVLIADCFHIEHNQITSIRHNDHDTDIYLQNPLKYPYVSPLYIGKWRTESFYIAPDPHGNYAFYYQVNDTHPEILSKNITAWQIKTNLIPPSPIITILFTMRDTSSWKLQSTVRA